MEALDLIAHELRLANLIAERDYAATRENYGRVDLLQARINYRLELED